MPKPSGITNVYRQTLTASMETDNEESHTPRIGQLYGGITFPRALRPGEVGVSGRGANALLHYRGFLGPTSSQEDWHTAWGTSNSIIDSNGFIKSASPIIRLFDDRIETNGQFKEEPVFEKIGVGTYKISNTLGLAKEGWTYEKPRGKDGNPYFRIIVKKTDDGCIISVHDEFEALEEATITDIDGNERKINKVVKILGEARAIKDHERWVDLRFHEEPEEIEEIEEIEDLEKEQISLEKHLEEHNAILLQERK